MRFIFFPSKNVKGQRGFLMLLGIVFGAIFITLIGALSSYVLIENRLQNVKYSQSEGFTIAEAGIEYYKWFLAHYPGDTTNGTGQPGPYSIPYSDPEGGTTGTISLTVNGNVSCGQTTSVDITSVGTPSDNALASKTVYARYAQPSVGTYSYILNDSVWAGSDRVIQGPYHSNGGIRMDGTSNSSVSSSLSSWLCTSSFGCSPNSTKNGVFGSGSNSNLWQYPTPQVDFNAISANFTNLKTTAKSSGKYWGDGNPSNTQGGYHLIFNSDGTVTVKHVTKITAPTVYAFVDGTSGTGVDNSIIKSETTVGTYTLPQNCGLIFVENRAWIEGTITKKITVVVADVTSANGSADAILKGNIVYSAFDGSAGLTLITQDDVLIAPNAPDDLTLDGVFIAQGGAFGRNLYDCPGTYEPKGTLTILGTTVSNKRTGTKWLNGCGFWGDAGYQTRIDSFDRHMASDPPPFTPAVSTEYELMDWHEK